MGDQTPQNTVFPQGPNKKPIRWFILLACSLLIITIISSAFFVGIQIGRRQATNEFKGRTEPVASQKNEMGNRATRIGVIRTSGLGEEEKTTLNLLDVNFQVTDFANFYDGRTYEMDGYFLLHIEDKTIEPLLGKCVQVTGSIVKPWGNKCEGGVSNRSALSVTEINAIDSKECFPYQIYGAPGGGESKKLTLLGTVTRAIRPSPDIGYDYEMKLTEPFVDENSEAGSPQEISQIVVVPYENSVWGDLENNIGKEIEVEGYMYWGLAESKYLEVVSVRNLEQ